MGKLKKGQRFSVRIDGLSHGAEGVGRINEKVVFVPEAIPGDTAQVQLVHVKDRFAHAVLEDIIDPSPDRIIPSCPHAQECGGCQLQHMSYDAQLQWKRQQVQDAVERIGHLKVPVLPTKGMDTPFGYRNKAQFPLGRDGGQVVMGFFRRGTHNIVDLTQCEVQHPLITRLALQVKETVERLGIEPYDEIAHTGVLRHAVIRVSFSENKLMLVLVTKTKEIPHLDSLIQELVETVPELVSVAQNINPKVTNVIFGPETHLLWGETHLMERIGRMVYAISPRSFFQVNSTQTKVLYDLVKEYADLQGHETVLDLYCGTGTIGLYLAQEAKQIIGVETIQDAVHDAKRNAALNGIDNGRFIHGKAEEVVPKLVQDLGKIDCVILDPPRKGCEQVVLDTLAEAKVRQVVYVSCNPATLARDLAHLAAREYKVGSVQPVDLFPWTRHVECVVMMSLGNGLGC